MCLGWRNSSILKPISRAATGRQVSIHVYLHVIDVNTFFDTSLIYILTPSNIIWLVELSYNQQDVF